MASISYDTIMDRLLELADHFNIEIIEDACHAFRSNYKGRKS